MRITVNSSSKVNGQATNAWPGVKSVDKARKLTLTPRYTPLHLTMDSSYFLLLQRVLVDIYQLLLLRYIAKLSLTLSNWLDC